MTAPGFRTAAPQGRPPYDLADLLKLYIYGYMNRMRSSRVLERECTRNNGGDMAPGEPRPDHNTIARFRKDNPKAIQRAFRATVEMARNHDLIGAVLIAGDSTKLRAQNSKKNNYNKKKVRRHIDYIDRKLQEHNGELAKADGDEERTVRQQIENRERQRKKYVRIQKRPEEDTSTENPQISTSDPDSRHQIVRGAITEVCYTAQTSVDARNKIFIDCKATDRNDRKAMGNMLRRAKTVLGTNGFTALYDKGYHTGSEFKVADDLGVDTLVAVPAIGRASQVPDPAYNLGHLAYDTENDSYTSPQGHGLIQGTQLPLQAAQNEGLQKLPGTAPLHYRQGQRKDRAAQRVRPLHRGQRHGGWPGQRTHIKNGGHWWSTPSAPSNGSGASNIS